MISQALVTPKILTMPTAGATTKPTKTMSKTTTPFTEHRDESPDPQPAPVPDGSEGHEVLPGADTDDQPASTRSGFASVTWLPAFRTGIRTLADAKKTVEGLEEGRFVQVWCVSQHPRYRTTIWGFSTSRSDILTF